MGPGSHWGESELVLTDPLKPGATRRPTGRSIAPTGDDTALGSIPSLFGDWGSYSGKSLGPVRGTWGNTASWPPDTGGIMTSRARKSRTATTRASALIAGLCFLVVVPSAARGSGVPPSAAALSPYSPRSVVAVTVRNSPPDASGKSDLRNTVVSVTEWLVAPDNTPKQLHDKLKAKGVPGLLDPETQDANQVIANSVPAGYPPEPSNGCDYGAATTIACPAPHWARNGFPNPRVYFNDQSSSAWPVGTVISLWNQSPKIAPRWAPSGCPVLSGSHCVWVNSGGYGASGWLGITYLSWDGNMNFLGQRLHRGTLQRFL